VFSSFVSVLMNRSMLCSPYSSTSVRATAMANSCTLKPAGTAALILSVVSSMCFIPVILMGWICPVDDVVAAVACEVAAVGLLYALVQQYFLV